MARDEDDFDLDDDFNIPEEEEEEYGSDEEQESNREKNEIKRRIEDLEEKKNQIDPDDLDSYYNF